MIDRRIGRKEREESRTREREGYKVWENERKRDIKR
jgi:hypothetical protein